VQYSVLGPLEARSSGRPVALGAPRQRALLALLILNAGHTVSTSRLVDDLWGEAVPDTAAKMVQILVSQLRKVLPRDHLVTRPPGYLLDVPPEDIDLLRFEGLRREAREAAAGGDHAGASALLGDALGLWRGPALAEFSEPFAQLEANRLEELRLAALEERIEADLALGRHAELVGELDALVARHPLRESLRRRQMLALYRSGRQAEALAAYQEARRALSDELGIEPSADLRELERRILQQDPELEPVAAAGAGAPAAPPPGAVALPAGDRAPVGRERALALLAGLYAEARSGRRRVVFVTGEAGIGKTALAEAFAEAVDREGGSRAARGQCIDHRGAGEPFMPILEALGRLARGPGGERVVATLSEVAPTWLVQMPWLVPPDQLDAVGRRALGAGGERMLREMLEALDALTADAPLVLVLEDLHWADHSTLDLLEALAFRPDPARLMVIGTFRPGEAAIAGHPLAALSRDLRTRDLCVELRVEPLSEPAIAELLARRLPAGEEPASGLAATIRARTGGNCLFVKTLVDAWLDEGLLGADGASEELVADVPESVRQLIEQMLLQLPDDDQEALMAASAVGTRFSTAAAAAATGSDPGDVEDRCAALSRRGAFVVSEGAETWPDGTVSTRFAFTHDLCREVLYERVPAGRRATMHARVGARLEAACGDGAGEIAPLLASHYGRSTDGERAVLYLGLAAEAALRRGAHHEAIRLLGDAIEILLRAPEGPERARRELTLRIALGNALITVRGYAAEETRANYARAQALAERLGDGADVLPVLYGLWNNEIVAGQQASALEIAEAFLRLAEEHADPAVCVAHRAVGLPLLFMGRLDEARGRLDRIPASFDPDRHGDLKFRFGEDPGVAGASVTAWLLWLLGLPDPAADMSAAAIGAARALDHPLSLVYALLCGAMVHQFRGEPEAVAALAEEADARAGEYGIAVFQAWARLLGGWAAAQRGDGEGGIARMHDALEAADATGSAVCRPFFLTIIAESHLEAGRPDAAGRLARDAGALAEANREVYWRAEIHRLEGEVALAGDPPDEAGAEEAYRRAIAVAHAQGARALELRAAERLGRLLRSQGREDEARALAGDG
jgi:DNA-binding SARP family transcriptional activator/predicted ATPase